MESCFQFWDFHMHIGWHGKWNPHSVFSRSLSWVVSWYHLNATKFKVFLALIISDIDFGHVGFIHFFYIVLFILFLLFIKDKGLRVRYALPRCMCFSLFFFLAEKFDFSTNFQPHVGPVHCSWTHKFYFLATFSLKMGPTVLFTHLKIILLQWFQQ